MEQPEQFSDEVAIALRQVSDRIVDQLKEYYKPGHALAIALGTVAQICIAANMKKENVKACLDRTCVAIWDMIDVVQAELAKEQQEKK